MTRWCAAGQNHIWLRNDKSAQICCSITNTNKNNYKLEKTSDFFKLMNSESWIDKYKILETQPLLNDCDICIKNEKRVNDSQRLKINNYTNNNQNFFLKIDFSNKCNLKCTMCSSSRSTSWIKDEQQLNELLKNNNIRAKINPHTSLGNNWWNDIDIDWWRNLGAVEISGGEPLYQDEAVEFLDFLALHCPEVNLKLITNTTIMDSHILSIFKTIKNVSLLCSVDAWEDKIYEYARRGTHSLSDVKQNILKLKQNEIKFNVCDTLHCITYDQFERGTEWLKENNIRCNHIKNFVYKPNYLDIYRALPKTINKDSTEDQCSVFVKWIQALDKVRNTNILDIRPEFGEMFDAYS